MKTTENQEKLVTWAVETLAKEPCFDLPEGFLARFETQLSQEPEPSVVVELLPTSLPEPTQHWTRGLMAALVMLAVLGAFLILKPKSGSEGVGLVVVSALNNVEVASMAISEVTELKITQSLVTKADSEVVLMAGELGNTVRVGPDSKVRLNETARSDGATLAELSLERGSLYVSEKEAKISVRTRHAHIRPIGTQYRVIENALGTSVSVSEGSVLVTPLGGSLIRLNAGEQILVDSQAEKSSFRPVTMKSEPLKSLKKEFETSKTKVSKPPQVGAPLSPYPKRMPSKTVRPNFGRANTPRRAIRRRQVNAAASVRKSNPTQARGAGRRSIAKRGSVTRNQNRKQRVGQSQQRSNGARRAQQSQQRRSRVRRAGVAFPKARAQVQGLNNRSTTNPRLRSGRTQPHPRQNQLRNRTSRPTNSTVRRGTNTQGQTWKSKRAALKKRSTTQRPSSVRNRSRATQGGFRRR